MSCTLLICFSSHWGILTLCSRKVVWGGIRHTPVGLAEVTRRDSRWLFEGRHFDISSLHCINGAASFGIPSIAFSFPVFHQVCCSALLRSTWPRWTSAAKRRRHSCFGEASWRLAERNVLGHRKGWDLPKYLRCSTFQVWLMGFFSQNCIKSAEMDNDYMAGWLVNMVQMLKFLFP